MGYSDRAVITISGIKNGVTPTASLGMSGAVARQPLHPERCTLHPTPYTLHTSYTLSLTP